MSIPSITATEALWEILDTMLCAGPDDAVEIVEELERLGFKIVPIEIED